MQNSVSGMVFEISSPELSRRSSQRFEETQNPQKIADATTKINNKL